MYENNNKSGSDRAGKGGFNREFKGNRNNDGNSSNRFGSDKRSGGFNNRSNNRRFDSDRPRQMFKVVCSDCKQECEVPFKPTEGRDVYCRDCFRKHKPQF